MAFAARIVGLSVRRLVDCELGVVSIRRPGFVEMDIPHRRVTDRDTTAPPPPFLPS